MSGFSMTTEAGDVINVRPSTAAPDGFVTMSIEDANSKRAFVLLAPADIATLATALGYAMDGGRPKTAPVASREQADEARYDRENF